MRLKRLRRKFLHWRKIRRMKAKRKWKELTD